MMKIYLPLKLQTAKPPKRGRHSDLELPHITIQMPVYKEGLKGSVDLGHLQLFILFFADVSFSVIMPTVESLLKAIKYYEAQGGTASIYVNEDGMQAITPDLAE